MSGPQDGILRSIPDVVLRYTLDGVLEWASPSLENVFGLRPADVVGTRFRMTGDATSDPRAADFEALIAEPEVRSSRPVELTRADGTSVTAELTLRPDSTHDGQVTHLVAVVHLRAEDSDTIPLYRILAQNTSDVVLVHDPWSVILWASPSVTRVLGHRPADLVGSSERLVHPDDLGRLRESFQQAVADRATSLRSRVRIVRADGSFLWIDASSALVWSPSGELQYEITSLRDVHEQVLAEEELQESVARFTMLLENSHDVVYQFDDSGRLVWITANVTDLVGWLPEELIGSYRLDFVHPDDVARADAARQDAAGGGLPSVELRLQTRDGGHRWVEVSTGVGADGEGPAIAGVGVIRDIDARRAAQTALAASERTFRMAMRDSAVGMCLFTPEGRITRANQALCDFLGRSEDEVTSSTWQEFADPAEVPADLRTLALILRGEQDSMRGIRRYCLPDGGRVVGDLSVSAIRAEDGTVSELIAQVMDVTEQTRVQEQLATSEAHYRALTDAMSDVVVRGDNAGYVIWVSQSLKEVTGWDPEDLIGRTMIELIHPNDVEIASRLHASLDRGQSAGVELRIRIADGSYKWFALSANPIVDADGTVTGRVGTWRDLTDEVATRRLLAQRETEFRQIAENAADVVFRMDEDDRITWASASSVNTLGYLPRDLIGRDPKSWVHRDDLLTLHDFAHSLEPNTPGRLTIRVRCADGEFRWFSAMATRTVDTEADLASIIVGMRNIDGEVRAVEALARSEEQFRLAMASAPSGMAVVGRDGRFAQVNNSLAGIVGQSIEWLQRHELRDIVHLDDWPVIHRLQQRLIDSEFASGIEEIRLVHASGATVRAETSLAALRSDDGDVVSFVAQFIDVTQARQAQADLHHAATHDPLTQLGNRRGLSEDLGRALARIPRTGTRIGILALDLDGLKPINDEYGHATGDQVLVSVGQRLRTSVREDDPIARIGGDEFVVVLVGVHNVDQVAHLAEKIRDELSREITVDGLQLHVTVSIGAVLAGHDEDAVALLARADAALYEAKQSGRDRVVVSHA